ncbi:alpha/beta fold hydrolase [Calidifontibacter sp. DB0510]|uniref:Alpha/beta fold hydrolase n=1 Tax=Metallococcus carri TaxID=1656884 RepID=A0A967E8P5_9MICO|nr:alpha/beta fold hydrolase [Metallococcus carri]NHN54405.1 alpha/beta fold hydrolase [Metallococcus carri]NOP36756.1 alpha/beta fold hydrolase [Calidifontibacter sp. DB2511S]
MKLHTTSYGEAGPRVAFCHGLFGQGRNWTGVAKAVADDHRVTLLDLPDHGRSAWSESFSYKAMAAEVASTLREIGGSDPWAVVGHSMGGKVAMILALSEPDLVSRLCVVDIAPVDYGGLTSFDGYVEAMAALDLPATTTRAQADRAMRDAVPDDVVRAFLLQNLRRDHDGWRWQMNLDLLARSLPKLGGWPRLPSDARYDGPVVWVAGADSAYITPDYRPAMEALFPRVRLVTVKNAGHWVHSQQPATFTAILRDFLR